jgi:cytosine/adenosine deaminase-related metal-dependent hydrolase
VGPAAAVARRWSGLPEVDLGHAILIPGLVDVHCHLEWSLTGGLVDDGDFATWLGGLLELTPRMRPEDHATAALLGALRCIEHGTTTVADSGPTGAGAAALREAGLRGAVHLEAFGRQTGEAARNAAAAVAARVADLEGQAGPMVRVGVSPHAPYTVGPELWAALTARADLADRPWATHLAESPAESRLLASGDGPLAELFARRGSAPGRWRGSGGPVARLDAGGALRSGLVAAHCVQLETHDPARLGKAGVAVAHCPVSNRRLRCGRLPIASLRDHGVVIGLGTDSPASAGDYDLRAEARACAETHGDTVPLPADELLRLATLGGAEALGLADRIGSIEPGKRADLVALTPSSGTSRAGPCAAALDAGAAVTMVMVDGLTVMERGTPLTLDRDAILACAAEARSRLARFPVGSGPS